MSNKIVKGFSLDSIMMRSKSNKKSYDDKKIIGYTFILKKPAYICKNINNNSYEAYVYQRHGHVYKFPQGISFKVFATSIDDKKCVVLAKILDTTIDFGRFFMYHLIDRKFSSNLALLKMTTIENEN